jgi:hypothetical protein
MDAIGTYWLNYFFPSWVNLDRSASRQSVKKVENTKNNPNKISVVLSSELRASMAECMKLEGYRVVSEFVSVAIQRRCREIQRAVAEAAHPVSEK